MAADRLFASARDRSADAEQRARCTTEALLLLARSVKFDPANRSAWQRLVWELADASERVRGMPRLALQHGAELVLSHFSPDGTRIVAATKDGSAVIWNAVTGREIYRLEHSDTLALAVFSPDSTRVLTFDGNTAIVWNAATGSKIHTLAQAGASVRFDNRLAAFSMDGARIMAGFSPGVKIWNAVTGTELCSLSNEVESFSPDGMHAVTLSNEGTATVWDTIAQREVCKFDPGSHTYGAQFSMDGKNALTFGAYGMKIWSAVTGKVNRELTPDGVRHAVFSPDGTRVSASVHEGNGVTMNVWNAQTGEKIWGRSRVTGHIAYSPDGTRILTVSGNMVVVWDAELGRELSTYSHRDGVAHAAFSPDGERLATVSHKTIRIWELGTGRQQLTLAPSEQVAYARFNRNGAYLATTADYGNVKVWETATGRCIRAVRGGARAAAIAFGADGTHLVVIRDKGHYKASIVLDIATGKESCPRTDPIPGELSRVSFDGSRAATLEESGVTRVWDPWTGKDICMIGHANDETIALSVDGSVALLRSERRARLWDARHGVEMSTLDRLGFTWAAKFSPDGAWLATYLDGNVVRLWDVRIGLASFSFPHDAYVRHIAFSGDAKRMVSGADDNVAKIWDLESGRMMQYVSHQCPVFHTAFGPSGRRLVTASYDDAKVWNLDTGKEVCALSGLGSRSATPESRTRQPYAAFSPNGRGVVTAGFPNSEYGARLWDLTLVESLPEGLDARTADDMMAVVELFTETVLNANGEQAALTTDQALKNQRILDRLLGSTGALTALARWLTVQGPIAPATPGNSGTRRQRASILIAEDRTQQMEGRFSSVGVRDVLNLDPGHPLIHIALARWYAPSTSEPTPNEPSATESRPEKERLEQYSVELRRAFLFEYAVQHLPKDASICAMAAEMLLTQNDKVGALKAAAQALALDPQNEGALRVQALAK